MSQQNATPSTLQKLLKSPKIIVGFVCILIILVIFVYSVVVLVIRHGKVAVSVTVAPYTADLTLNGMRIRNNRTIYLEKGHYHLVAEAEHFDSRESDIVISDNQHYIAAMLEPIDETGEKFKETHQRQFSNAEGALGLALNAEGKDLQEKYPLVKYLPINNRFYSISYQSSESGVPDVNIKTDLSYLDVAIAKLKTLKGKQTLSWKKISGATGYVIYQKKGNGSFKKVKTISSKNTSYTFKTAKNVTYSYRLVPYRTVNKKVKTGPASAVKTGKAK